MPLNMGWAAAAAAAKAKAALGSDDRATTAVLELGLGLGVGVGPRLGVLMGGAPAPTAAGPAFLIASTTSGCGHVRTPHLRKSRSS